MKNLRFFITLRFAPNCLYFLSRGYPRLSQRMGHIILHYFIVLKPLTITLMVLKILTFSLNEALTRHRLISHMKPLEKVSSKCISFLTFSLNEALTRHRLIFPS